MKLSHGARRCLNVLRTYGQNVFPKQETLARRMKCGLRTVSRYIGELRESGCISVLRCGRTSAEYRLNYQYIAEQIGVSSRPVQKSVEKLCIPVTNGVSSGVLSGVSKPSGLISEVVLSEVEQTVAEPNDDEIQILPEKPKPERTASGAQDGRVMARGTLPPFLAETCVPLAEMASESISGEVAAGLPPPSRKRPQPECRDGTNWNAAISSLASRKALERGFG